MTSGVEISIKSDPENKLSLEIELSLKSKDLTFVNIDDETSIAKIHNLLINDFLFEPINEIEFFYMGVYYDCYNKKSIFCAEKYYLVAAEKGNVAAMNNLGCFYENIKLNYPLAKKYYLMAIQNNCVTAMYNFALYHKNKEDNSILMQKYHMMAIKNNHKKSFTLLYSYYSKNIYDSTIYNKYFFEFINFRHNYNGKVVAAFDIIKEMYNSKLEMINAHFKYSPDGIDVSGFNEAKNHFYDHCNLSFVQ